MNLRALILLGWKKTDTGQPPVVNLYTGNDGSELTEAHAKAQKSGGFIAFRKVINPSGIPLPMTVDPAPKHPVFPKVEITPYEPNHNKRLQDSAKRQQDEKNLSDEKRAADKKIWDEKQAAADAALASKNTFDELNGKTKADLSEIITEINLELSEDEKFILKPELKKLVLVNFILTSRGITPPANEAEENE